MVGWIGSPDDWGAPPDHDGALGCLLGLLALVIAAAIVWLVWNLTL